MTRPVIFVKLITSKSTQMSRQQQTKERLGNQKHSHSHKPNQKGGEKRNRTMMPTVRISKWLLVHAIFNLITPSIPLLTIQKQRRRRCITNGAIWLRWPVQTWKYPTITRFSHAKYAINRETHDVRRFHSFDRWPNKTHLNYLFQQQKCPSTFRGI